MLDEACDSQHCVDELKLCKERIAKLDRELQNLTAKETPYFTQFMKSLHGHFKQFQHQVA